MIEINSISQLIQSHRDDLCQRGVKTLAVLGSVARVENTPDSDLDILVEFDRPVGLFEFIRLKYYLESLTACNVDLVTRDAIRPAMRENIIKEAIYVA